jgi:hypothetical protein
MKVSISFCIAFALVALLPGITKLLDFLVHGTKPIHWFPLSPFDTVWYGVLFLVRPKGLIIFDICLLALNNLGILESFTFTDSTLLSIVAQFGYGTKISRIAAVSAQTYFLVELVFLYLRVRKETKEQKIKDQKEEKQMLI